MKNEFHHQLLDEQGAFWKVFSCGMNVDLRSAASVES